VAARADRQGCRGPAGFYDGLALDLAYFAEAEFTKTGTGEGLPEELEHVWDWYLQLNVSFGGVAAPAFHVEVEAFARLAGVDDIEPWEVDLLRRLYRIHAYVIDKKSKPGAGKDSLSNVTDARDGPGVAGLMRGLGAKKAKKEK
jgi:hypothetical protein